uniref:Uncharacterized protein n=1 Tax=Setaria italica TaxID=4555 RepID=K4A3N8_SETIT
MLLAMCYSYSMVVAGDMMICAWAGHAAVQGVSN